jgi:hypothetical protein
MHLGKSFISAIAAILPLWQVVTARSATGERILVVIEHDVNRERYSGFWQSLQRQYIANYNHETDSVVDSLPCLLPAWKSIGRTRLRADF